MRNLVCRKKRSVFVEALYVLFWLIILFVLMPHVCRGLAYSSFYRQRPDRLKEVVEENEIRANAAQKILLSNNYKFLFDRFSVNEPEFCFVVVTTGRPQNPRYLTQTVASLVGQLEKLKRSYTFAVYNNGGELHPEAMELAKIMPVISNKTVPRVGRNSFQTQKIGYSAAMKWCLHKNARYNVVIEDDVIATSDFIKNLNFIMNYCLADKEGKSWGFLKLFYPEKFQAWGNNPSSIVELLMFTLLFGFTLTFLSGLIFLGPMEIDLKTFKIQMKCPVMYFRLIITNISVFLVMISLGRAHWEELRKLNPLLISVVEARGCCTQAVLFPRTHFNELVHYLDSHHSSFQIPYDLAMDQFVEEKGLQKLLAVPNLFNHIGMISSLTVKGWKQVREFDLLFPPLFFGT